SSPVRLLHRPQLALSRDLLAHDTAAVQRCADSHWDLRHRSVLRPPELGPLLDLELTHLLGRLANCRGVPRVQHAQLAASLRNPNRDAPAAGAAPPHPAHTDRDRRW